ncbi:alpha/beta hydrolase [Ningiella sp. W23]|uniref:alpha/beta hydrolase n=1 Tax=Ningiella sp. W23 TaxID=3023715 RepID=UPI003757DD50
MSQPFLLLLLICCVSACALKTQVEQTPSELKINSLAHNVAFSDVTSLAFEPPAQVISYGEDPNQQIWRYRPLDNQAKANIVFIHGGCWLSQFDIEHTQAFSSALSKAGYQVWSLEYRRAGNGGEWPVAIEDIVLAVHKIKDDYPDSFSALPLVFMGHSAGGHLAMLASAKVLPQNDDLNVSDKWPDSTAIGLAPIVDIIGYSKGDNACQSATPVFMGGDAEQRLEQYQHASVLNYDFESGSAFVLIGGKDTIVDAKFARHPDATEIFESEAGHFDWIHPGTFAFKHILDVLARFEAKP